MPTLREFSKRPFPPEIAQNPSRLKFLYWNMVVKDSPKFKGLDLESRNKIHNELVTKPGPEILKGVAKGAFKAFKQLPGIKHGDIAIEKTSQFIEPTVPAGRTKLGLFTKDLPRQITADFIRGFKPSTFLPFLAATKVIAPVIGAVAKPGLKAIARKIPAPVKKFFLKQFTVGKGQPQAFRTLTKAAQLKRAVGAREAEQVAKTLTTAPAGGLRIAGREGLRVIKPGKPIPLEQQRFIGRIFRKEIDLGGKQSGLVRSPEVVRKIAKNIEVEMAFNPEIQALNKELRSVNILLRNKELKAQALVGKKFFPPGGSLEKATAVSKITKILKSGKPSTRRFDIGLETEAISPILAGTPEGQIVRGVTQVSKAFPKTSLLSRKQLLTKRASLSSALEAQKKDLHIKVRSSYDLFDRTFSEQIRTHPKFQELSAISDEGRVVMDKWSAALAKSGIPTAQTKEVIEANVGQYMGRMFTSKLQKTGSGFGAKDLRLRLGGLKHRKNLNDAVLRKLGEIKEPALPTAIRVKEISGSIANDDLFNTVAKNPEWVANTNTTGTLIKMPDTRSLGALRNKWVVPEIGEEINAISQAASQAQNWYAKGMGAWKYGKVVLNPATHARNMMSNSMLLDLSGTNHIRQARLYPKAFQEYLSKGRIYQQALKDGALGGEFVGGDVLKIRNSYMTAQGGNLQKWMNVLKTPFKKAGDVYQGEEQLAKLVKYMDVLERGGTSKLAASEAQKWLFDYREIPNFIKGAKHIAPFITFTYKALPRIGEALINNPMKIYKYKAFFDAINSSSRKMNGMSTEEFAREQKALPPWMLKDIGGMPTNLLMPWKDKHGRTQWLNLEYILPIGQAPEIAQRGLKGLVSNPIINIVADLTKNVDFKGDTIIPVGATRAEAVAIATNHIYRQMVPSLTPGLKGYKGWEGGYSFAKIMNALDKTPDSIDRIRSVPITLLDTLVGLKINPLDVDEAEGFRLHEKRKMINDLKSQIRRLEHPAISEEFREKRTEEIFKKIQRIVDDI